MFDWVSYPVTSLIEQIYEQDIRNMRKDKKPCQMRVELIACLERALCYCHTGNASVFATTLMNPLGLSRGAKTDRFPVLMDIFKEPTILGASYNGFTIDPHKWPPRGCHPPAMASKRAQVLTYSTKHYMVRTNPATYPNSDTANTDQTCVYMSAAYTVRCIRGAIHVHTRCTMCTRACAAYTTNGIRGACAHTHRARHVCTYRAAYTTNGIHGTIRVHTRYTMCMCACAAYTVRCIRGTCMRTHRVSYVYMYCAAYTTNGIRGACYLFFCLFLFCLFCMLIVFQSYLAHFRINHFLSVGLSSSPSGSSASSRSIAEQITELAFMAFLDDTKQLVAEGVRSDIARRILEASPDDKMVEVEYGDMREKYLKEWLKVAMPLSYGSRDDEGKTYKALVRAVVSQKKDIRHGLPNRGEASMSKKAFVDLLIAMSSPSSPATVTSPVLKDGSFLPILKEVHSHLLSLSGQRSLVNKQAFVLTQFVRAVDNLKIRFVPFHLPRGEGRRGAPRKKVTFNAWRSLGLWEGRPDLPFPLDEPSISASEQAAADAHASALAEDSNADWYAKDLTLSTLHTVLHHTNLPVDFAVVIAKGEKAKYVNDTYVWLREVYDGTKPIHHLALIIAIIASLMLPNLWLPDDDLILGRFEGTTSKEEVRAVYESIPWVEKVREKGMKEKSIFVAMFSTFIIAIYEPDSPLRRHMDESQRCGLGNPWINKNGMFPYLFLQVSFCVLTFFLCRRS